MFKYLYLFTRFLTFILFISIENSSFGNPPMECGTDSYVHTAVPSLKQEEDEGSSSAATPPRPATETDDPPIYTTALPLDALYHIFPFMDDEVLGLFMCTSVTMASITIDFAAAARINFLESNGAFDYLENKRGAFDLTIAPALSQYKKDWENAENPTLFEKLTLLSSITDFYAPLSLGLPLPCLVGFYKFNDLEHTLHPLEIPLAKLVMRYGDILLADCTFEGLRAEESIRGKYIEMSNEPGNLSAYVTDRGLDAERIRPRLKAIRDVAESLLYDRGGQKRIVLNALECDAGKIRKIAPHIKQFRIDYPKICSSTLIRILLKHANNLGNAHKKFKELRLLTMSMDTAKSVKLIYNPRGRYM